MRAGESSTAGGNRRGPSPRLPSAPPCSPRPACAASARSGESLVEVLVSILLLFVVFCSWAAMNNIQAVRRESCRYAAVEKAAGILDAMTSPSGYADESEMAIPGALYKLDGDGRLLVLDCFEGDETETAVHPMWPGDADSAVGYRIRVSRKDGNQSGWTNGSWGVVSLYPSWLEPSTAQKPYAEFKVLVERNGDAGARP